MYCNTSPEGRPAHPATLPFTPVPFTVVVVVVYKDGSCTQTYQKEVSKDHATVAAVAVALVASAAVAAVVYSAYSWAVNTKVQQYTNKVARADGSTR